MGKEKRDANRNTPAYNKWYNSGPGRRNIIEANKVRRQLQRRDGLKKNPPGKDAGHYKGKQPKGKIKAAWQDRKDNRARIPLTIAHHKKRKK